MLVAKKIIYVALLVIASNAALASVAYAAGEVWYVNNEALATGSKAALSTTAKVATAIKLRDPSESIQITCSTLGATSPQIVGPATSNAESVAFGGCSESEPKNCTVESAIITEPIVGTAALVGTEEEGRIVLKPKTGAILAGIDFLGGGCAIAGEKPLRGSFTAATPLIGEENTEQPIEALGSIENNSLEIAGHKAYFQTGKAFLRLSSGMEFSFGRSLCWRNCPKPECECKKKPKSNGHYETSSCAAYIRTAIWEYECYKA
jgi:hypothetical protein